VLEKDGEDRLGRSCGKWRSTVQSQGGQESYGDKKDCFGDISRRQCVLKHVIEGKVEGRIEVTGRRGRRRTQLPEDLAETKGTWKFQTEALDRTVWRTGFGRGDGPVVRHTIEWVNEWIKRLDECIHEWNISFLGTIQAFRIENKFRSSWLRTND
jgi:hypothetical protein